MADLLHTEKVNQIESVNALEKEALIEVSVICLWKPVGSPDTIFKYSLYPFHVHPTVTDLLRCPLFFLLLAQHHELPRTFLGITHLQIR